MSGSLTQLGIINEATYGTAVAVTKFYEIVSEDLKGNYERTQAEALSSAFVDRADRFAISQKGASGTIEFEPLTKGFGHWLRYMMGTVVTSGPSETTVYTHTGTIGSLTGRNLTVQVGRAQEDTVVKPWTYEGGKVMEWELSNSVDQTLRCSVTLDFEKESNPDAPAGAYVLATNVPVTGAEVFTWAGATISVGGSPVEVDDLSIKVDNALNADRWYLNQGAPKREPIQDGKRMIDWSFKTTYANNTFWEKVSSATNSGSYAVIEAKWNGLTLLGSTIYPNITVTIPVARFDEGGPSVDGPGMLEQTFSGKGLFDGTLSPITVAVQSADVTVI
jgi:hypothetical protein